MVEPVSSRPSGDFSTSSQSFSQIINNLKSMAAGTDYSPEAVAAELNKLPTSSGVPSKDLTIINKYRSVFQQMEGQLPSSLLCSVGFGSRFIDGMLQALGIEKPVPYSGTTPPTPSSYAIYETFNHAVIVYCNSSAHGAVSNNGTTNIGAISGYQSSHYTPQGAPGEMPSLSSAYQWVSDLSNGSTTPKEFFTTNPSNPGSMSDMDMLFSIIMNGVGGNGTPTGENLVQQLSQDLTLSDSTFPSPSTTPLPSQDALNNFLNNRQFIQLVLDIAASE